MRRHSASLYDLIVRQGGHFYVCGDVTMASDVRKTLESIIQENRGLTAEETVQYVIKMRVRVEHRRQQQQQ